MASVLVTLERQAYSIVAHVHSILHPESLYPTRTYPLTLTLTHALTPTNPAAGLEESEEEELPELTTEQVTKMERNIKGFVEEYAMNSDYDEAKLCLSELEADGYGATVVQLAVSSVFEAKEKYALACAGKWYSVGGVVCLVGCRC